EVTCSSDSELCLPSTIYAPLPPPPPPKLTVQWVPTMMPAVQLQAPAMYSTSTSTTTTTTTTTNNAGAQQQNTTATTTATTKQDYGTMT
ncbi:unnamed protein product, partial [Amoebophrya sp. A25]